MLVGSFALLSACGSKKDKVNGEEDVSASGLEPEANTGPVEYPEPPRRSSSSRTPVRFDVSLQKAYVLPLSADGKCFDPCSTEVKTNMIDALPGLAGNQFASAAKALTTSVGAKNGTDSLPDIYVQIDCGFGQVLNTTKAGAENRLLGTWRGASAILELDPDDQCAISVWDADDDGQDELIGDTVAQIVRLSKDGNVVISSDAGDFGQVFMVELFIEQQGGAPVTNPSTGTDSGSGSSSDSSSGSSSGSSGSSSTAPSAGSGQDEYYVEVLRANVKEKKADGQAWDMKLPFVGKAGDEAADPFVTAWVNGYKSEKAFLATNPGTNQNFMQWNQGASTRMNPGDKIHFMVWDKDTADHDLVGECISDAVGVLSQNTEITVRNCGQVEALIFKITRK